MPASASLERSSSSLADLDRRSAIEEEDADHRRWHQLLHRVCPLGGFDRSGGKERWEGSVECEEDEDGDGSVIYGDQRRAVQGIDASGPGNGQEISSE